MLRFLDKSSGFLFSSRSLRNLLEERSQAIRNEIEQIDSNQLLNTSTADFAKYLHMKYVLEAPSCKISIRSIAARGIKFKLPLAGLPLIRTRV